MTRTHLPTKTDTLLVAAPSAVVLMAGVMLAWQLVPPPESRPRRIEPLDAWRVAVDEFRTAGDELGAGRFDAASRILWQVRQCHPKPYRDLAENYLQQLAAALTDDQGQPTVRAGEVGLLCHALGGDEAAIAWFGKVKRFDSNDLRGFRRTLQWSLEEVKYAQRTDVSLDNSLFFVRERYPQRPYVHSDHLRALRKYETLLKRPLSPAEQARVYEAMIERLASLGDEPGAQAWEDAYIAVADDEEIAAEVLLKRARRLMFNQQLAAAQRELRSLRYRYPRTTAGVDAGYELAWIEMDQGDAATARKELTDIVDGQLEHWPSKSCRIRCLSMLLCCFEHSPERRQRLNESYVYELQPVEDDSGWCTSKPYQWMAELRLYPYLDSGQDAGAVAEAARTIQDGFHSNRFIAWLVRWYASANQLSELEAVFEQLDQARINKSKKQHPKHSLPPQSLPSAHIRPFLRIEHLRQQRSRQELLAIATDPKGTNYACLGSRLEYPHAQYAADTLAELDGGPEMMIEALDRQAGSARFYQSLARSRSPVAKRWLKKRLTKLKSDPYPFCLLDSLVWQGPEEARELYRIALRSDKQLAWMARLIIEQEAKNPSLVNHAPPPRPGSLPKSWPIGEQEANVASPAAE